MGIGSTLAVGPAELATLADFLVLSDAEQGELGQQPEQSTQRTENPTIEARVDEVERQRSEEHQGYQGPPLEVALALIHAKGEVSQSGHDRGGEAAPGGCDGIEQADLHAARRGQAEDDRQHQVLDLVRAPRGVLFHPVRRAPLARQESQRVVQDPHGADP